jgi:hypothetical protein
MGWSLVSRNIRTPPGLLMKDSPDLAIVRHTSGHSQTALTHSDRKTTVTEEEQKNKKEIKRSPTHAQHKMCARREPERETL